MPQPSRPMAVYLAAGSIFAALAARGLLRSSFWAITALLIFSVPLLATVYIALSVVFTSLATEETRGVTMGIYSLVLYVGLGLGPAVFGTVMEKSGYTAGFTACAATGLVLVGLVALLRRRGPVGRPRPSVAPGA